MGRLTTNSLSQGFSHKGHFHHAVKILNNINI